MHGEAQVDPLVMSQMPPERISQAPRMQGNKTLAPFWVPHNVSTLKGKANKRFASKLW